MTEQKFVVKLWTENYIFFQGEEKVVKKIIQRTKKELSERKNPTKISYTTIQE
jgi:hypothetical protein